MKLFLFSKYGDAVCLAIKAIEIGHQASVYIKDAKSQSIGDGLVKKVKSWEQEAKSADLILFDHVGFGNIAEDLRKDGKAVLGGCRLADALELNRAFSQKTLKLAGINTPLTSPKLSSIANVKDWLAKNKKIGQWVYKAMGSQDTGTTYVSEGIDDLLGYIPVLQKRTKDASFILQERVDGTEVSHEGWFNGKTFCQSNITFEEKRFMDEGRGRNVGCMGNIVYNLFSKNKLHKKTLGKMVSILRKADFRGPIDLNCIVTENEIYALEFTPRLGYDAVQAFLEGFQEDWLNWMLQIAQGATITPKTTNQFLIAVRLATSPYPEAVSTKNSPEDIPLIGLNKENLKHIWLSDVKKNKVGVSCAGADGVIAVVTARGNTVKECKNRVYRTIGGVIIPDKTYRIDIGSRVPKDLNKLKKWGWI